MTIRIEVSWKPANLRATAEHLLRHAPNVGGREPLDGLEDAQQFLIRRLKEKLDYFAIETAEDDCFPLQRPGYWAQVSLTEAPEQQGSSIVSTALFGTLTLAQTIDSQTYASFSMDRPSDLTATRLARVKFLIELA